MTEELKDALTERLDAAKTTEDTLSAITEAMKAILKCQFKAGIRIKQLVIERDREQQRRIGAKWVWGALGAITSAGGGALVLKLLATVKM